MYKSRSSTIPPHHHVTTLMQGITVVILCRCEVSQRMILRRCKSLKPSRSEDVMPIHTVTTSLISRRYISPSFSIIFSLKIIWFWHTEYIHWFLPRHIFSIPFLLFPAPCKAFEDFYLVLNTCFRSEGLHIKLKSCRRFHSQSGVR